MTGLDSALEDAQEARAFIAQELFWVNGHRDWLTCALARCDERIARLQARQAKRKRTGEPGRRERVHDGTEQRGE
ncbi:MAG: hypothetical protein FJX77_03055 [Armatimonadetes bacterium]|nr:hypothetical protein [Armatimonadota bacterium]